MLSCQNTAIESRVDLLIEWKERGLEERQTQQVVHGRDEFGKLPGLRVLSIDIAPRP